jgi:cytochrome oxidase Cu insertion factor (SCO1/SenC/PrrC family)
MRLLFGCALLVAAAGAAGLIALAARAPARSTPAAAPVAQLAAAATWPAGTRRAPAFSLHTAGRAPLSLASLRGHTVLLTFLDPLCRNLCPLEARILGAAARMLPPASRPAIVAVSVNPWGDTTTAFAEDAVHWRLPAQWRWATGTARELAAVWRRYQVDVRTVTTTIRGVKIRSVEHTELTYVVDANGDERAVYVFPFTARDVVAAVHAAARRPT